MNIPAVYSVHNRYDNASKYSILLMEAAVGKLIVIAHSMDRVERADGPEDFRPMAAFAKR